VFKILFGYGTGPAPQALIQALRYLLPVLVVYFSTRSYLASEAIDKPLADNYNYMKFKKGEMLNKKHSHDASVYEIEDNEA
jgi:hypothetical protein